MSDVKVTAMNVTIPNKASDAVAASTFAASDNVYIPCDKKHTKVIITPTAAGNIVFKAGDSFIATNDLTIAAVASKDFAIDLDSSSFEITQGANKGNILMIPAVAGSIRVVRG